MPLGIVSDNDFEKELGIIEGAQVPDNIPLPEIIPIEKGRGNGSVAVPETIQKLIGETAITEGRTSALAIADFLGISKSSTSAYTKGAASTSSYNEPKPSLVEHLNEKKVKISNKASSKLIKALNAIDDDSLEGLKAKDLSSVAKDMSVIIKNFEPENPRLIGTNSPTIVFYAPRLASEDKFDVITVNE